MTVQEYFEAEHIFRGDVEAMADESEYNEKASKFITENWETDMDELTLKQSSWASRILDDMIERRIYKRQRG